MKRDLHDRLKHCRISLNLSEEYVARFLMVPINTLQMMENGKHLPTEDQIEKFALLYGCDKDYFNVRVKDASGSILARNGKDLSEFDQMQILELLAFQEQASKQRNL
ncbi:MAG: helix-turn-helix domain-containing protein [Ectobacillus sp.]